MSKGIAIPQTAPLVVIEGADGTGKTTQVKLLVDLLRSRGKTVKVFDFPQYGQTLAGTLVHESLYGKHGNFLELDPYLASLPFTLDRVTALPKIRAALMSFDVVLANRYTTSNVAYQAAKFPAIPGRVLQRAFIDWIEQLEYVELGLPAPSLVIYLDLPTRLAARLRRERARETDQHEADSQYQQQVGEVYRLLVNLKRGNQTHSWKRISAGGRGEVFSREEVHTRVVRVVEKQFPWLFRV